MELRIGELAGRLGLNPRTIRYYEQIALLPEPERSDAGYRLYGAADEERLRFIRNARRSGFGLGEIKEILALRDRGEAPCAYVASAIDLRLREVDDRIAELERVRGELVDLRARARSLPRPSRRADAYCHILERGKRDSSTR